MIDATEARKRIDDYLAAKKLGLVELYDAIDMATVSGQIGIIWSSLNITQIEVLKAKGYNLIKQGPHTYFIGW